jgi:DNA repair exonuclease SbcCD ATPase subunit
MINHVEMINWRAYDQFRVSFGPGITFIMGENGTGKTSILEAIAYALTGEPSTVDRTKLLRNPDELAIVRLSFLANGQLCTIERSQSSERAGRASLTEVGQPKALASTHRAVTAQVERLMGVSTDFLQRIVYMAEGDVFRFLSDPPGEALDLQIRRVLGLTQLDEFTKALGTAEKEIKDQIKTIRRVLDQCKQLDIREDQELAHRLRDLDVQRGELLTSLRSVEEETTRYRRENEDLIRLSPLLDRALVTLERYSDTLQMAKQMPVLDLFSELERQTEGARAGIQKHQTGLARLDGEQVAYQRILDILLPYAGHTDAVPCPVCRKPMTAEEREYVVRDIQESLAQISSEREDLARLQHKATQELDELVDRTEGLRELRNFVAHVSIRSVEPSARIDDLKDAVREESRQLSEHLKDLEKKAGALDENIAKLERERAEYLTLQSRLHDLGYTSLAEAREASIRLEIRSLSLRAAESAAQNTLAVQRNVDMEAIYAEVAQVWGSFMGREGWRVQLGNDGMPVLEDETGRRFDLSQFSGGEKTALLVILHTIIARYFSRSDFLLIDEPLEHLDPVNRRSLVRFLTSAYHREAFKQVIVTTFEESLIRKYLSEEGVSVIHL